MSASPYGGVQVITNPTDTFPLGIPAGTERSLVYRLRANEEGEFTLASYPSLRTALGGNAGSLSLTADLSVADAAKPYVLAALHDVLRRPTLLIVARPGQARVLRDELACWHPRPDDVLLFPEQDVLPYESLPPDSATVSERLAVLTRLSSGPPTRVGAHFIAPSAPKVGSGDCSACHRCV